MHEVPEETEMKLKEPTQRHLKPDKEKWEEDEEILRIIREGEEAEESVSRVYSGQLPARHRAC